MNKSIAKWCSITASNITCLKGNSESFPFKSVPILGFPILLMISSLASNFNLKCMLLMLLKQKDCILCIVQLPVFLFVICVALKKLPIWLPLLVAPSGKWRQILQSIRIKWNDKYKNLTHSAYFLNIYYFLWMQTL